VTFYSYQSIKPVVGAGTFVHPSATLIGDVIIGASCYIGPGASLRGDFGRIVVEDGSNVQDNCVMHSFPDKDCVIESGGHIGHCAILHGCRIGRNALVGMGSVVMDGATVGEEAIIGAMSFLPEAFAVPPRMLALGTPARLVRRVTADELARKTRGTAEYRELAAQSIATLSRCEPLAEPELNRRRIAPQG